MSGYSVYSMTKESLTEEMNNGKEIYVKAMLSEGIITKQQYEQMQEYSVVIAKKGFFGSLWDKLFSKDDGGYYFIVKVVSPKNPSISEEINQDEEE